MNFLFFFRQIFNLNFLNFYSALISTNVNLATLAVAAVYAQIRTADMCVSARKVSAAIPKWPVKISTNAAHERTRAEGTPCVSTRSALSAANVRPDFKAIRPTDAKVNFRFLHPNGLW